jgi:hypothetical protein
MQHFICPISPAEKDWIDSLKKRLDDMNAEYANLTSELLTLYKSQRSSLLRTKEICRLRRQLEREIRAVELRIEAFYSDQVRETTEY